MKLNVQWIIVHTSVFRDHRFSSIILQGKIKFHDDPKFHEYQSEDAALKDYLEQNPHETEEVKKQEEAVVMTLGGSFGDESSDDVDEPVTPREDSSIKSNTPLGHSGW